MSRSSAQRQQQKQHAQELLGQPQNDSAAAAAEYFDMFCQTTTMRQVLGLHRNMCDALGLRPSPLNEFYPKLKEKIKSWKAQALFKKFDARAAHRVYGKGNACSGTRVLVIGAGPCGLRTAIEAQLLGAKVVVVEKRDRISRNNVLHLWPFVITDLRNLGAKKFYGKFCAGSIDHISIRQLQCILLKVALLLGVEVHEGVSFENTIEPSDGCGWRAEISPADHVVSHYEFDVLIGADGKRNTLEGFKRKEFRGKLAIAITANFVNRKTEAEAKAEEISGVAFIFNQSFFKELYHTTGIDLENIVYYKDETHYFVMTAKKHSLIDKGVIMQDCADPAELLSPNNVNREKLLDYAREAAEFSTKYQMPNLDFAVNHYGKPDVAMFDFTSMFAAETSCRVTVRKGYRLLQCLVGDSLLEPFWPTGSGCARGFLSSMDAAYTIKLWANPRNCSLGVLAQRESIYRLLGQTTPENLQRDIGAYTMDPATRYPNLNRTSVNIWQVKHLIDTDDPSILEQTFMDSNALQDKTVDTPVRRKRRSGDTMPLSTVLLRWICAQLHSYEFTQELKEVSDIFTNGKVLCALINRYRPDLVDFNSITTLSPIECNELAFKILEREMNIPRIMSGKDSMQLNSIDSKVWLNYLEQICEVFRGEIPHVKHPKMDVTELREKYRINHRHIQPDFSKLLQLSSKQKTTSAMQDIVDVPQNVQRRSVLDEEKVKRHRKPEAAQAAVAASGSTPGVQADTPRRAKKRRNVEKSQNLEERQKRLEEIEHNRLDRQSRRRQQRYQQTQNFYKSLHMLHANTLLRESDSNEPFEDYSIFLYRQQAPEFNDRVKDLERKLLFPDRERSDIPSALPRGATDEQFNDRIKSMEQRMVARTAYGTDKKPKDLMRAIGKIDSSDWNVREIEKKIEQAKKTEIHGPMGREKVPKWSKEQFMARQNKMAKPSRQDSSEEKFKEIDRTIKNLDKQLKEGNVLEVGERGRNKVASIAGQFVRKEDNQVSDDKNVSGNNIAQKSSSKVALAFKKQAASEKCHFCKQTVYLMEKTIAEDLTFHRACLKCHHCHTSLRMGGYAFDRDDPNGRFYCTQHFRLPAKAVRPVVRRSGQRKPTQQQLDALAASAKLDDAAAGEEVGEAKTPEKLRGHADSVAQLDLLDRGQTPERIEFENTDAMSDGEPSEEHIIDEHEWSGRNFLPESNNDSESDLSSSDESDSETDSDIFEEVNDSPLGAQTLQLATDWIGKQNYTDSDDSDDFYDSSEGIADDGKDDTEGEEFKKARELRREEVRLLPLPPNLPTDTETESKMLIDNKENVESVASSVSQKDVESVKSVKEKFISPSTTKTEIEQEKFVSPPSSPPPTKTDIEKIEQRNDRKFSAEIDAISEKLYHMNNMVKMNKDLEVLAKDNLVKSDIMKKLTLKEKWLAENNPADKPMQPVKSKFEEKIDAIKGKSVEKEQNSGEKERKLTVEEVLKELKPRTPDFNSSRPSPLASNPLFKKAARENMLDIVKDIDMGKVDMEGDEDDENKDIGKLLYDIENRMDPMMASKMKEIETKNFAGTMDLIKSQMIEPSTHANANIDLAKYFPNQKQDKISAGATNKNQKNLKDVDLAKYFPTSPQPSRKSSVVTVAEQLKRSSTEKSVPTSDSEKKKVNRDKKIMKKGESFNLRDHQLDGAVDLPIKPKPVKIVTTAATAKSTKKGNVKIIKAKNPKVKKQSVKRVVLSGSDDPDDVLDEIWRQAEEEMGSPSLEYQDLFQEEKSPSEDVSDKLEGILEECGIDMGKKRRKKITKAKSFAEGDLKYEHENKSFDSACMDEQDFDDEDRPKGVQNILKRFESLRSVKPEETTPQLVRKESTNKSRDSIVSQESVVSLSDLEKTMDYLKSEWRNEATNFLQMKRDKFFGQKRTAEDKKTVSNENLQKKTKTFQKEEPQQSKLASFFCIGAKQKSPEKKTQLQKSPKSSALPIKNDTVRQTNNTEKVNKSPKMKLNTKSSPKKETVAPKTINNNVEKIGYSVSLLEDESEKLVSKLEKETSLNNKNVTTKESVPISATLDTTAEVKNIDVRTEDIKNLPKTGCDKSQNNSRRGSIQSVGSRRCSYTEKLDDIAKYAQLLSPGTELKSNIDELFDKIVTEFDGENNSSNINNDTQAPTIIETKDEECDSLCTTISKSPSCEGLGVKLRGSSEDRSIENLFSRFTDEMLVNVEFDSNDELLSITPKHTKSVAKSQIPKEFPPEKPPRRSKSSSSSESCIPVAPQRLKKKLSKLSPYDVPPSIQDKRKQIASSGGDKSVTNFPLGDTSKYDRKEHPDESLKFPGIIKAPEICSEKKENTNIQKSLANRRLSKDSRDSIRQQPVQSTTSPRKMSIETTESKNLIENQAAQKSNDNSAIGSELKATIRDMSTPITSEVSKEIPKMNSLPLENDKATALSQKGSKTIENVEIEETTPVENLERKKSQTNFDLRELESLGEKRRLIEAKYKERRASRGSTELNETEKFKEDPITTPVIHEENKKVPINLVVSKQKKVEKEEPNIKDVVNNQVHEKTPAKKSPPLLNLEKDNHLKNQKYEHQQEKLKNVENTNQHKEKNKVEDATAVAHTPVSSLEKPTEANEEAREQIEYTNKKQSAESNNNTTNLNDSTIKNVQSQKRGSIVSSTGSEMEEYEKLRQHELLVKEKEYPKMEEDNKVQKIQKEQPKQKENSISPEKLIAQFETERRLSLIERDKEYMEKVKIEDWYKPPEISKSVPPQFEHEKSSSVDTVAEVFKNRQWPDGVTDFTKTEEEPVLEELSPEVEEIKECSVKEKSSSKEQSVEVDMEQVMASPMPRRRTLEPSPEPDTEENKIVKALEQERRQSIIEREKLYEERKASNASTLDTQSLNSLKSMYTSTPQSDDNKMLDLKLQSQSNSSPTGSMNLLNNLAQNQQDMENQLLRQNEEERRKSLLKREQEYAAKVKPEDLFKDKNGNSNKPHVGTSTDSKISSPSSQSKLSTPLSQSKLSTPLQSKRSSPVREGTPPMLKKLDIVEKTTSTTLSSRRPSSTFAMLEHLEKKEPVIAPMPKKLEFPKVVPKYVPEMDDNQDSVAEVFQNRPWPKQELNSEEEEEVLKKEVEEEEKPEIEICYPLPEVFKNRQWPDGVTKYEEKQRANSLEPTQRKTTEVKSFAEIMKKPVSHDSVQSLPQTTAHSSRSSAESDYGFARPQLKTGNRAESIDASTRILLSRGKHLHDRKCDFLSDQQKAERYKRPAVSADDRLNVDDDNLLSYRPRSYAGTTRFPSSSDLSRRNRYDYLGTSSSYAPISDYSSSSRIPSSSVGLGYHVPTVTSSGLSSAHLTDYYRRSPSRHMSRDTSIRDSCKASLNPHLQMKLNLIRQLRYPPIRNSTMMKSLDRRQKSLSMTPI